MRTSALVSCYRRREYVAGAVLSAARAGYDEVAVLKDFGNPTVDEELRNAGATVLNAELPGIGEALAFGIACCSGDVVSFLDDDDLFLPGKAATVRGAFADSRAVLYRNGWSEIDAGGKPAYSVLAQPAIRTDIRISEGDEGTIRWLNENRAYGTLSTISARRSELIRVLPEISEVECGIDVAVGTLLMLPGTIHRFDPAVLTLRRVGSRLRQGRTTDSSAAYFRTFDRIASQAQSPLARRYAKANMLWSAVETVAGSRTVKLYRRITESRRNAA